MLNLLVSRAGQGVLVLLVVSLLSFVLFNFVGDPVGIMAGEFATQAQRDEMRQMLGLNASIVEQYGRFLFRLLHGELGISYQHGRPVLEILLERLPATLELSLVAMVLAVVLGVVGGCATALWRGRVAAQAILSTSLLGISLPPFFVGFILILVFSVNLGWLPSFGRGEVVDLGWWTTGFLTLSGWKALVLPALTLSLYQTAIILRLVRAEMLEALRADHIRFARARGVSRPRINFRHALKNAIVPVVTVMGLQFGSIIAFSVVTETVFQWPGIGFLLVEAINFSDIPVMSAYLLLIALVFLTINLVVDILYYAIDPRLSVARAR